jgi:2,3-bisphosphoglycerate-dependent phosphoglycerate mutase
MTVGRDEEPGGDERRPVTRLLLIRHGETAWNAEHRIQGHLDIPLSPAGVRQSALLAARLASERIDAIYSSELLRAWLTAVPISDRLGLPLMAEARLRERAFGIFEGLTLAEIAARYPDDFRRWRQREPGWQLRDGETGQQLIDRVLTALHEVSERHPGQTVVAVTHGGVLDVAYRAARALAWDAPREHQMLNAAVNRIAATVAPLRLTIEAWSDIDHLSETRDELLS